MEYAETKVMEAFKIYTTLARDGCADLEALQLYRADDQVRLLLDRFSNEVDCAIVRTGDSLYFIPLARLSPFHVSNEWIRREALQKNATNADLYLLYFSMLVLFGSFYDRYESREPTMEFLPIVDWLNNMNERIAFLQSNNEEKLQEAELEYSYNWRLIIEKWLAMDDIKETAKSQAGNTISRLSFIDKAKKFLVSQDLVREIGNDEVALSEKAKTIVQRYFMDEEHNRGIFEFLYEYREEQSDASN